MPLTHALGDPAVSGPLGTLALAHVRPRAAALSLRAVRWQVQLGRLGVHVPLAFVNDLGLLLACPNEQLDLGPRTDTAQLSPETRGFGPRIDAYRALVAEVAQSATAQRSNRLGLSDDLVVVLLARLLSGIPASVTTQPSYVAGVPLHPGIFGQLEPSLATLYRAVDRSHDLALFDALLDQRLRVLTLVDALDLDTLQLFGMVGGDSAASALAQVDLLLVLGRPEANDVVDFSLEILPSVLETKARSASTRHAAHGYAGLARKGSLDSLVLTELAWDPDELMRRLADDEVLYYARESAPDEARHVHHLLIDASASMRGERATFARGIALALAKKITLSGASVSIRFFDSRLYEAHPVRGGKLPVAHLLSFRGEHGRNPARVFRDLVYELDAARDSRATLVHLFTNAALHVPRELVSAVAQRAHLTAVFMLPSAGGLRVDYLDLLAAHWVVDHDSLARGSRANEARRILDASTRVHNRPREVRA